MAPPEVSTGDPLSDEWSRRVYTILRQNNGTLERCLDGDVEDFAALTPDLQREIRDLTDELLADLIFTPSEEAPIIAAA